MLIISIIVSITLGVLLHYTYELSNCNPLVGIFSATNESVWEHLKLSYFPILIVSVFEYFILGNNVNNFIASKMFGIVFTIVFTISVFYIYSGVIGKSSFIIDIIIYIVGIVLAQIISYKIMELPSLNLEVYSIFILIVIGISFIIFTINPLKIQLFKDPIYKEYGSICAKK